jgi:transcription elongation factor Elf1
MNTEKMTMDEAYTCPRCGNQHVDVGNMEKIFDDARSEDVTCMRCQSTWRIYYKMFDFNKKTLNITDTPFEDTNNVEVFSDDVIRTDCHVVNEDGVKPGIVDKT